MRQKRTRSTISTPPIAIKPNYQRAKLGLMASWGEEYTIEMRLKGLRKTVDPRAIFIFSIERTAYSDYAQYALRTRPQQRDTHLI